MPFKSDEERKAWDRERKRKQVEGRKAGVENGVESSGVESSGVTVRGGNSYPATFLPEGTERSYVDVETGEIITGVERVGTGTIPTRNHGVEEKDSTPNSTPAPCSVEHLFDPDTGLDWQPLKTYIGKPTIPGQMANLERLQRVAGALGKRAEDVRFGLEGPTFKEVGKVLGTEGAMYPR